MEFRSHVLENGLEIVAECNPKAYSLGMAFFVKTGSRDENDEISGVSHFLEHMMFKGTAKRTAERVNQELDEMGSRSNAYTSEEQTVYYATVLPEYQHQLTELLSDIMRPSLRQDDFDMEKKVILEEIAKYDDEPPFGAHEKCMHLHFGEHPLGRSVLGTTESVSDLTREQMHAYFETRYSPGNIALAAAGNVNFDQLVDDCENLCGKWQAFETKRDAPRGPISNGFHVLHKPMAYQQYVVQVTNGPAAEDADRYAARLLATIFGDGSGSRLYWDLVETGRAEYAAVDNYEYQGTGILMSFVCCMPDEVENNLERLWKLQQEIQNNGVTEAELAQAKSKTCSHVVLQSERPTNRMFAVGNHWIQRRNYRTVREIIDAYQAVTVDEIHQQLQRYPMTPNTTVTVGPLESVNSPW